MVQFGIESEDGWRPATVGPDALEWITVPGTDVQLQVMKGWPSVIMRAYAADYNAYVEPLRDTDSASWTPMNSVATSNHLNGTAMDLNWGSHPFQVSYAGYTPEKITTMRELLKFYEGTMFWAQDWDDPKDPMHHQLGYNTWNQAWVGDFITRKIDPATGFSTFRRDPLPAQPATPSADHVPALPADDAAAVLYDAVPIIDEATAAALADRIVGGLALAQCNTVNRIAMWLAQIGHESDGFKATEEYQKDGPGWSDDRRTYLGRTWIQITWKSNYAGFSKWAWGLGMVGSPSYFVDHPAELADDRWAAVGPAWYWTVARPTINSLCDQGGIVAVTKLINGGLNGLEDSPGGSPGRRTRYNQAVALGDRLLTLLPVTPPAGGPLMALTDAEQQELLTKTREIWDQLRGPGGAGWAELGARADGNGNRTPVDAIAHLVGNKDA